VLFGGYFAGSIQVLPAHDVVARIARSYEGLGPFVAHGLQALPFVLAAGGLLLAWLLYLRYPYLPERLRERARFAYNVLLNKYYVDEFNEFVFARGARALGRLLWKLGDVKLIDGLAVNGTARLVGWAAAVFRHVQSGYVYHYAFAMILGVFLLITFFLHR
jgi:NADH-quinone oxidoreductase subunit L